jgi:hypothetical protein
MTKPTPGETEKLARLIASQLRQDHSESEGITVQGTKVAGTVFVIGNPERSAFRLIGGWQSEETIRSRVIREIGEGGLPVGFVRWQSQQSHQGAPYELKTYTRLFPFVEHLQPWAGQVLKTAEDTVRSNWLPLQ